ncbi:MAG: stage II sporulation protein M [Moorellales bacterium]
MIRRIFPLGISVWWPALFAAGVAAGCLIGAGSPGAVGGPFSGAFSGAGWPAVVPGQRVLSAVLIFARNSVVAAVCLALGRPTRGLYPAAVCFVNGVLVGGAVKLFEGMGVAWWKLGLVLVPHGVPELCALFAACTAGVAALSLRERFRRAVPGVLLVLAVAAAVEVSVSVSIRDWLVSAC